MKMLLAFLFAVSVAAASDSVKSGLAASDASKVQKASFRLVWSSGQLPDNIEDLRLNELEDAAGITRYVWEMAVPAGQRLILRFSGKSSDNPQASVSDNSWAVNGPLASCFANRICLVRHSLNNSTTSQLLLQINTQCPVNRARSITWAFSPIELKSGWGGDWGAVSSPVELPGTAWEMHLGTEDRPNQIHYKFDVSLAPADPSAATGEIVTLKR